MIDEFTRTLKDASQSVTLPRLAVFKLLQGGELTIAQLIESTKAQFDRATIYRTIELFERLGVAHEVGMGRQRRLELSDRFDPHHHHITCDSCGASTTLSSPDLERQLERAARRAGYQLQSHQVELKGICRACQT